MSAAKNLQQERERADMQNHIERMKWLSADMPRWSCGEPVDAHTKHCLLAQSQAAITKATGAAA